MGVARVRVPHSPGVATRKNEAVKPARNTLKEELKLESGQYQVKGQKKMTRADTVELTKILDNISKMFNSQLSFKVHEESERLYVQFIDRNTKEVIKQIPPEELLELSAEIQKMVGLILDKYV